MKKYDITIDINKVNTFNIEEFNSIISRCCQESIIKLVDNLKRFHLGEMKENEEDEYYKTYLYNGTPTPKQQNITIDISKLNPEELEKISIILFWDCKKEEESKLVDSFRYYKLGWMPERIKKEFEIKYC